MFAGNKKVSVCIQSLEGTGGEHGHLLRSCITRVAGHGSGCITSGGRAWSFDYQSHVFQFCL